MSYVIWHTYGYSVELTDILCESPDRIKLLLSVTPDFEKKVNEWFKQCGIKETTVEDYAEFDQDYHLGLAYIQATANVDFCFEIEYNNKQLE